MTQCKFFNHCMNRNPGLTCSSGGGNYCGKFRTLSELFGTGRNLKKFLKKICLPLF